MGTTFSRSFYDDFSSLRHQMSYKQKQRKMRTKIFLLSVLFFLLFSFNGYALLDRKGDTPSSKCPPYFKVYVEDEILYLNPLRTSVSVQIINEWNEIVHEEFIPVDQPQLYMIPVDHLPCGSYTVLIVGEQMNYMFELYF